MAKIIKAPRGYSYDPYSKFVLISGAFPEKILNEFPRVENLYFLDSRNSALDWRLVAQARVDLIVHFVPDEVDDSLLELGIATGVTDSLLVCCKTTSSLYPMIKTMCEKFDLKIYSTYNDLLEKLQKELNEL